MGASQPITMAMSAAIGGLRRAAAATTLRAAPLAPRSIALPAAPSLRPGLAPSMRSYVTVVKYDRDDVLDKLNDFHSEVYSTNWADYLNLVYSGPFWEAELEKLTTIVQPYLHEPEVGAKFRDVQELMDVLYQCEDVRDHLNELAELATRASGLMGTGYNAGEKVANMGENAAHCAQAYDNLLKRHPNFKPKIEQTVGHGLAVLRQKHKFNWSTMYRYFF